MLSEPLSITYDGVQKSFARVSFGNAASGLPALFKTSDGEFQLGIIQLRLSDGIRRVEIYLERVEQDSDSNPFTGSWSSLPNRFGFVMETNHLHYNSDTDLPLLQDSLELFMDSAIMLRLINGES